jgi:TolA-binding protein
MTTNLQKLTLFCVKHQETFTMSRTGLEVVCDQGPHVLSENYLQQKWNYCCSCQSFFARNDADSAKERCLVCDREITARYLCNNCDTLAFETESPPLKREFALSQAGLAVPVCPCCLKASTAKAVEHSCTCLKTLFTTARSTCPFCEAQLVAPRQFSHTFPAAFRRPVAYYLNHFDGKAFRAGYSETQKNALAAQNDGRFWLTMFQDEHTYMVFPSVTQAESAQAFLALQKLFDCNHAAAGEVWLVAPAVAICDTASGEYIVAQKGKLEVQALALAPPPLGGSHFQPLTMPPPTVPPPLTGSNSQPLPPPFIPETTPDMATDANASGQTIVSSAAEPKSGFPNLLLISGIGLVALVLIVALIVSSTSTTKSQIIAKVKQGQMVSPAGDSAYDIFLRSNLSDSDKDEIRNTATPALENYGSAILTKIARDSYEPSNVELSDLIRVYNWLDTLAPKNFYKARKQYFQGWQYYQSKDYKNAGSEFTQAMNMDSSWALPVNKLAQVALRYRDYDSALNWYQKASERDPKWLFPYLNLGMLALGDDSKVRNYALAEEAARKALAIDPNKASAYFILGRALEGQNRVCEALSAYRSAIQNAANTPSPGFNVSNVNQAIDRLTRRASCETE